MTVPEKSKVQSLLEIKGKGQLEMFEAEPKGSTVIDVNRESA